MTELSKESSLLRNFISESDKHAGKPLYEWIVLQAREQGLAGATVMSGLMGFGAYSRIHTFKIERLSEDFPVIIEIVDTREKLEQFLALRQRDSRGFGNHRKSAREFYRHGNS